MTSKKREEVIKFYKVKKEVRILGIDDAPFSIEKKKGKTSSSSKTILIGTIFRGGSFLDGVLKTEIEVDGFDATEKIIKMVNKTRHDDLRVIMLDGITFGGFNLVDIEEIFQKTKLPVITIIRRMPDFEKIKKALTNLDKKEFRMDYIKKAGTPKKVETKKGKFIYIQFKGLSFSDAKEIVKLSSTRSLIPEPIRVSHLIASGVVLGESKGGA